MNDNRETAKWNLWQTGASGHAVLRTVVLLVVLAGSLAFLLRPHAYPMGKKVKIRATKTQIAGFATVLEDFRRVVGRYPRTTEGLHVLTMKGTDESVPLIRKIPLDPWSNEYQYACPGMHNADSYDLSSFGPDGKPGGGDDITNWADVAAGP